MTNGQPQAPSLHGGDRLTEKYLVLLETSGNQNYAEEQMRSLQTDFYPEDLDTEEIDEVKKSFNPQDI